MLLSGLRLVSHIVVRRYSNSLVALIAFRVSPVFLGSGTPSLH